VTIASNCSYSLNPTSASQPAAAGSYSVTLTATTGCAWTATSNVSWMTITKGASGSGNGTISYSLTANTVTTTRSGALTIAGLTFPVTQAAAVVTTLSATSANATAAGGNATVTVNASSKTTTWKAVSNVSWIVITAGASGTGTQNVGYNVAANSSTTARTGTMTIAGLTFTVNQAGSTCSYKITLGPLSGTASGATGSITVTAPSGCKWTAVSNVSWVTIKSGASGSGNGTVTISIAPNKTGKTESGTLLVAGYTITVTVGITGSAQISEPIKLP